MRSENRARWKRVSPQKMSVVSSGLQKHKRHFPRF